MSLSTVKRKINTMLHTPRVFMKKFQSSPIFKYLPDKIALKIQYKNIFLKKLDLDNPKTFNEKLQWLKLYNRKPEYSKMVDKYEAKKYVASIIGEEYIIPTYGVWSSFDEIDFDELPSQFVLKCTHGSGDVVVVNDKKDFDIESARQKIEKSLKTNYYKIGREWPYKNVKPRVIAEKYMEDVDVSTEVKEKNTCKKGLTDYKIFCFDGEARLMLIATDRFTSKELKFDYFDRDFNWLDFEWTHIRSKSKPQKPPMLEEMFQLAEKLSKGFPHVRVDFYQVADKIYFGELTFFHAGGFEYFKPEEWDYKIGSWIDLSKVK